MAVVKPMCKYLVTDTYGESRYCASPRSNGIDLFSRRRMRKITIQTVLPLAI
jgi:hypothetical protein